MRIRRTAGAIFVLLGLLAASCGDDGGSSSPDTSASDGVSTTAATAAPTTQSGTLNRALKVTSIGFPNEIVLQWANEKKIFDKYGVKVEFVKVGGGAASLAAVTTNAVDLGFTNGLTAIQAFSQGFGFKVVLGAYENAYPWDPAKGGGVVATVKSGVQKPCDLEGKKVGVTELGGIGQLYLQAWFRKKGCNVDNINFVTVPAGQTTASLETDRVAATSIGAYVAQDLVRRGVAKLLGEVFSEVSGRMEYAMYIASNDFIAKYPATLSNFNKAMNESLAQVNDPKNRDEMLKMAAAYGNTTVDKIDPNSVQWEKLDTVVDIDLLQNMVQILVDGGSIAKSIDVTPMVYKP